MEKTLQEKFLETKGKPLQIGSWIVFQLDRIPIKHGIVKLNFLSEADGSQGVAIKAQNGSIKMSNSVITELLHIWHEKDLISTVEHEVECPTGELKIWNIYRIIHPKLGNLITEDKMTGNAGMVLLKKQNHYRKYGCSDWNWKNPFSPDDLEFEIEWYEISKDNK